MPSDGHAQSRRLGALEVSVVGLGCNNFGGRVDRDGTGAVVDAALDAGVTLFDTADIYGGRGGSETLLGEVLRGRRGQVVLATKFGMDMGDANGPPAGARGSRPYVRQAVEGSLRRLQTDFIDLYQYHQPDGVTPIVETLGALHELVEEGVVRHVGCSNFSAAQLNEAAAAARGSGLSAFVSLQNDYSLLKREIEAEIVPACERLGVGVLPYFPLASGLLSGKYRRGEAAPAGTRLAGRETLAGDEAFDVVEALGRYAAERGLSMLEVAIGGLAAQPMVTSVIAGATRPEQIEANVLAGAWQPSGADLHELDLIAPTPRPAPSSAAD